MPLFLKVFFLLFLLASFVSAKPTVKIYTSDPKNGTILPKIESIYLKLGTLPENQRAKMQNLLEKTAGLLGQMANDKDGQETLHLVLVDNMSPNAFASRGPNGEKIIGIHLGLFNNLDNDAELAYVLSHELEHAHSQLQKKVDGKIAQGDFTGLFLQRVVENEVDIAAIRRLIEMGYSPHAAVDFLNRMRQKFGDQGGKQHTLLSNRVDSVGGAITVLVRGKGDNEEHRLDQLPRPRKVIEGAKEALNSKEFKDRQNTLVERFLKAEGAGETAYESVKNTKAEERYHLKKSFEADFNFHLGEIQKFLIEPLTRRQDVDLRLKLYKNLDIEYEKSREKVLGKTFHAENSSQVKALLALEERDYKLDTPNLFESAEEYFKALESIKKAEEKQPREESEIRIFKQKVTKARDVYEFSKYPYENNPELDKKLKAIYDKNPDRLNSMSDDLDWNTPRYKDDTLESLGLKLREVEELFRGERERIDKLRKKIVAPKLDPNQSLSSFIQQLNPANRQDHSVKEYQEILDTFETILKREFAPGRKKEEYESIIKLLCDNQERNFDVVWFRYHAVEPRDADKRLLQTLETLLNHASDPALIATLRDYLGSHKRLLSQESLLKLDAVFDKKVAGSFVENIKSANTLLEIVETARALKESFRDKRDARGKNGVELSPSISIKIRDDISQKLHTLAKAKLTPSQANTITHVLVPALMTEVGEKDYEHMGEDLISLAKSPELSKEFGQVMTFKEVVHAFADRILPQIKEYDSSMTDEEYKKNKEEKENTDKIHYEKRKEIVKNFYPVFRQLQGILNYSQSKEPYVYVGRQLISSYLEKMQLEEEIDLKLVKNIASQGSTSENNKSLMNVMGSVFQKYLKRYPNVSEATFQFWKDVDEAGIAPTYDDLNGISEVLKTWLPGKEKVKKGEVEIEILNAEGVKFFSSYLEGAKQFQEHVNKNGRKAIYSKPISEPFEELKNRVNFEHIKQTIAHAETRAKMGPEALAELYGRLLDIEQAPYASAEHDKILEELWAVKDKYSEVKKLLLRPEIIKNAFYHSNQIKIAQMQMEQLLGFTTFLKDYRLGKERLTEKGTVRPIIGEITELLKKQFPKLIPARNEILNFVENKLLPNEAETKLLNENKITLKNWTSSSFIPMADSPAIANKGLKDNQERLDVLRYLIGIDKKPPSLPDREMFALKPETLDQLQRSYRENGTVFRMLCLAPLLDDQSGILSDPKLEAEIFKIVMGKSYDKPALRTLTETYFSVVPASEKKALLTSNLAGYEPNAKASRSSMNLLRAGGPLGGKGGQGALTSGIADEETRADFLEFFDDFLKPNREEVFTHLKSIFGDAYDHIDGLAEIPGSGSLNYVAKVILKDPVTGIRETVVVRVQKDNVPSLIRNENKVWMEVYRRLKDHSDPVVRRLARFIEEVRIHATSTLNENGTELDLELERQKYPEAKAAYENLKPDPKTGFRVEVVRPNEKWQQKVGKEWQKRASVYEYIDAVKIEDISDPKLRAQLARQIIQAEHHARQTGTFDPDGHLRNWLIDLKGKRLVRIDTAQLVTLPPEEINSFNNLMGKLLGVSLNDRAGLAKYLSANFAQIFEGEHHINDLEKTLVKMVQDKNLPSPTKPIERLLFIQNGLETHYQTLGNKGESFPLSKGVKLQIVAEMRTAMFRRYSGSLPYMKDLADSIRVGRIPLIIAQARGNCRFILEKAGLLRSSKERSN